MLKQLATRNFIVYSQTWTFGYVPISVIKDEKVTSKVAEQEKVF